MTTNRTRTGIILAVIFAVGYGAYAWMKPATGTTSDAGTLGVNVSRTGGRVQSTASGNPEGFKGTDEELQVGSGN